MTVAQEIAALQEQCKVLEGDRDPTARAALLHKRAEIKRLQRQLENPVATLAAERKGSEDKPPAPWSEEAVEARRKTVEPAKPAASPPEEGETPEQAKPLPQGRRLISTTVYFDPAQFAALRDLSERTAVPYAEYVRRGVALVLADPAATAGPTQPLPASPTSAELRCLEWLSGRMEVWGPTLAGAQRQMVTELLQRVHAVLGRGEE